ncbi:MAG TPA: HPP family protein [Noviherbaspirillum sp.]
MEKGLQWLRGFLPQPISANRVERLRACIGALFGIFVTGLVSHLVLGPDSATPLLIAPMGASAVLVFAMPSSPLAQPWPLIGGNVVSAAVGVACAQWIPDPALAGAVAVSGAVIAMFALRCLHPPGGAIALSAVIGGTTIQSLGFQFVLSPVALNSALLIGTALVFNNIARHRYPHLPQRDHGNKHNTADLVPTDRLGFTAEDLDAVLQRYNEVLDISRDDLASLFLQAEMHAYRRRFEAITCGDIMSRDLVTVEFGTALEDAWMLLRRHKIKALPVIDKARRVIGIVTFVDFMKSANLDVYQGFDAKLRHFIRRTRGMHTSKAEVVGQIMTRSVRTAQADMHIVELVPLLSDLGLHHIPILDEEHRLAGMVTQSDMIAALYRGRVADAQAA